MFECFVEFWARMARAWWLAWSLQVPCSGHGHGEWEKERGDDC